MALLGFELLFRFLWGWFFVLAFVSRVQTSERFLRIAFWVALGLGAAAAALVVLSPVAPHLRLLALGLMLLGGGGYCLQTRQLFRSTGYLLAISAPFLVVGRASVGEIFGFFSSGLLLGSVFVGQFLGHWYLNVPGLHISELQRVVKIIFFALGAKTLELLATLGVEARFGGSLPLIDEMGRPLGLDLSHSQNLSHLNAAQSYLGIEGDVFLGLGTFGVLILITRVLWGLLAPWILGVLVKKTVDMRSTQSATGILYAVCVMVLVGEGAALYLKRGLGWNL